MISRKLWHDELRFRFFLKKITALKIDIGQIPFINGKNHTGLGPVMIDGAAGIILTAAQEGTFKKELAAFTTLIAFAGP